MKLKTPALSLSLGVLLTLAGTAQAEPYYNPANAASSSGKTTGYELYKTIGCPGRGILEAPCVEPAAARAAPPQAAPAPAAPVPATPPAPLDGDQDGVVDAQDKCPATPKGAQVDGAGCELDGDGDGVVDRLDQCPTTPPGRKVDAKGCELDGDGDGVVDALDQCPATPAGRKVDAQGCEADADGDGVVDALDQCPATPAGDKVDAKGCTLFKGALKGVNFDNDKADLRFDAIIILNLAVATLKQFPDLKVEVGGHTDSRNTDEHNLELSQRRAKAVLDYFVSQGIAPGRLQAKGYGESTPIADNETEAGRIANRRVELRVIE